MVHCKVWLDNYHTGKYYPGSQIEGKVILNFNSDTKFRNIKIRLICNEHTEWRTTESYTEPGSNESKTRDVNIYSDNNVVSTEIILFGGSSGTATLPPGQHMYPFRVMLPINIPSSFNCEFGSITYKIIALVDRPMAVDYEDQFIFIVDSLIDLNHLHNPQLLQSTSYSDDKTVCCLCCAQGPITMDVTLPKRTLIPGEVVNIPVRISNMSNTNIESLELKLIQKIECKSTTSVEDKSIENTPINLHEVGVGAHGEHTFTLAVQLPNNFVVPNFTDCKLFKVNYTYRVIAHLPGVHSALVIDMYPELGHIEIGQQAPINGYGEGPNSNSAGIPLYPGTYPPPGAGFPQYPPQGAYSPVPTQPFPQPPGVYPPQGYPPMSSGPGYSSKAQEAGIYPSAPAPPMGEQFPPSYDNISK
ncbi:arrestin domain-containing protein 5-like [Diorhabda carinulata]|uniref:arrestin domain-containing protein 5-like n=1 Tax=Diorhabda carinulata TaxID=1163345 RepID=UPI00259FFBEE|nr:arrestin domain-containing protein 5-like [Diorhabda carinulata]